MQMPMSIDPDSSPKSLALFARVEKELQNSSHLQTNYNSATQTPSIDKDQSPKGST